MDYPLISADDHVDLHYLPGDLWQKRVPAAYRDRVPYLADTPEGKQWIAPGSGFKNAFSRVPKPGQVVTFGSAFTPVEQEEGRWRPTTPELRLEDMDRDGVEAQVMFGGLIKGFQHQDPDLNAVCMRAYNEWIAEFCQASPKRLIGLGFLPVRNAEGAVAELFHCAELGLKGVQFPPFDCYQPIWHPAWDKLWAAAAETGLTVNFHVGGGTWTMPADGTVGAEVPKGRGAFASTVVMLPHQLDEVLSALVFSGALMRNPGFRIVLAECSLGWIPYVLDTMDRKHRERAGGGDRRWDSAQLDELPSTYWKRQCFATFQDDPVGVRMLDLIGSHTALWASDYPHTDSVWPNSHATVDANFKGVDPKIARMVLRENAERLYLA